MSNRAIIVGRVVGRTAHLRSRDASTGWIDHLIEVDPAVVTVNDALDLTWLHGPLIGGVSYLEADAEGIWAVSEVTDAEIIGGWFEGFENPMRLAYSAGGAEEAVPTGSISSRATSWVLDHISLVPNPSAFVGAVSVYPGRVRADGLPIGMPIRHRELVTRAATWGARPLEVAVDESPLDLGPAVTTPAHRSVPTRRPAPWRPGSVTYHRSARQLAHAEEPIPLGCRTLSLSDDGEVGTEVMTPGPASPSPARAC